MNRGSAELELLERYHQATPAQRRRGRAWYPEAQRQLRWLAEKYERPPSHVTAIFSIVSPATQLATALRWTEEILRGEREGGRYPNKQAIKIARATSHRYPVFYVPGPKVNAFYRALMGDSSALVLDRWAAFAAGHEGVRRGKRDLSRTVRDELEAAYRSAAEKCGETVRAFQAIVWIVVRESTQRSDGRLLRYADLTT